MATPVLASSGTGVWTLAANWVPATAPVAGDDVVLTGSQVIVGSDQSATALNSITARNYTGALASESAYLQLGLDGSSKIDLDLQALAYLDLGDCAGASPAILRRTATVVDPASGLYLKATNLVADILGGQVCLVSGSGSFNLLSESAILRQLSGHAITTLTTLGRAYLFGTVTNLYARSRETYSYVDSTITLMNVGPDATVYHLGSGAITTLTIDGGLVDASDSNETLTVTNLSVTNGGRLIPGRNWTTPASWGWPRLHTTP